MNSLMKIVTATILSLCIMLSSVGLAISADKYTGFIEDYPALEPDKDRKGALIYRKPGVDMGIYSKVLIDQIEIWYAPDSKYKGIKPDELKVLADAFREAIVQELEPDYPVVSKPGPGVLGLRIAITNVYVKKKKRGLLGYTPIGLVVTSAVALAGKNISLLDATIEVETLDSETDKRIGVLIDKQSASKEKKKSKTSWDEIEKNLRFYAKRLRARIDAEHGRQ
jgi:hypothetical protein